MPPLEPLDATGTSSRLPNKAVWHAAAAFMAALEPVRENMPTVRLPMITRNLDELATSLLTFLFPVAPTSTFLPANSMPVNLGVQSIFLSKFSLSGWLLFGWTKFQRASKRPIAKSLFAFTNPNTRTPPPACLRSEKHPFARSLQYVCQPPLLPHTRSAVKIGAARPGADIDPRIDTTRAGTTHNVACAFKSISIPA